MQSQASYSTSATTSKEPTVHDIFETFTSTWQYIVADPSTKAAVIIDPVLDYDPATQAITTHSADGLLSLAEREGYKIDRILETLAHADHLTAASYLQSRLAQSQSFKPPIGIGKRIVQVQKLFSKRYGLAEDEWRDVFDNLFEDDETFSVGELTAKAIHLPGPTPDHLGYQIGGKEVQFFISQLLQANFSALLTNRQIMFSAATPSSTQTSVPRAATSPAATHPTSSNPGADSSPWAIM